MASIGATPAIWGGHVEQFMLEVGGVYGIIFLWYTRGGRYVQCSALYYDRSSLYPVSSYSWIILECEQSWFSEYGWNVDYSDIFRINNESGQWNEGGNAWSCQAGRNLKSRRNCVQAFSSFGLIFLWGSKTCTGIVSKRSVFSVHIWSNS